MLTILKKKYLHWSQFHQKNVPKRFSFKLFICQLFLPIRPKNITKKKMLNKILYHLVPTTKYRIHYSMLSKGQNLSSIRWNIYYVQLNMKTFWIINNITRFNISPQQKTLCYLYISLTSVFRKIPFYRQHHFKYQHLLICVMN